MAKQVKAQAATAAKNVNSVNIQSALDAEVSVLKSSGTLRAYVRACGKPRKGEESKAYTARIAGVIGRELAKAIVDEGLTDTQRALAKGMLKVTKTATTLRSRYAKGTIVEGKKREGDNVSLYCTIRNVWASAQPKSKKDKGKGNKPAKADGPFKVKGKNEVYASIDALTLMMLDNAKTVKESKVIRDRIVELAVELGFDVENVA